MKSNQLPNVRLVRCPRCSKVLPEPTDVPLYMCGGCSTTLQAKHYKKADEGRETVSEGPGSVQNNEVEHCARGGEASNSGVQLMSSAQCSWDQNEGINQNIAQNDNLEQLGVSNFPRESSSSNHPNQQPPSTPDQHFPDLDEEREQNPEVTNSLREDYTVNEPSLPRHEEPSNMVLETGEVQRDHRSVEQCVDCKASSFNETMEQSAQLASGNGEVRQDEIVVEEQLESADSSSEDGSSETTTVKIKEKPLSNEVVDGLNQNASINCRLEQDAVASCSSQVLLSNEPSLRKANSPSKVAAQEGKVEGSNMEVNEAWFGVSNISNRPSLSNEPTVGETKLASQSGSPNGEVVMRDQNIVADHGEGQPGVGMKNESEFSSTGEHNFILERKGSSSQFTTSNQEGEGVNLQNRELSQSMTENREMDDATIQNELGECEEDQIVDNLPTEIASPAEISTAPDEHGNRTHSPSKIDAQEGKVEGSNKEAHEERLGVSNISNRPSLSNKPTMGETKLSSQSGSPNGEVVVRDQNIVADHREEHLGVGMKYESEVSSADKHNFILERNDSSSQFTISNQGEGVFLRNRELSQLMTETRGMYDATVQNELGECKEDQIVDNLPSEIASPAEVSTAPDEHGNRESKKSFEVDAPATSKSVTEEEIMNLANGSQKTVKANPKEKMDELQETAPGGFESAASSLVTETAAIGTHLQVGILYRDLPKSPTRNSFTYDGSVSSYDGNEAENPVAEDKRQRFSVRNASYSGSAFQHQTDNPRAVLASDSCHSAEESSPVMLNERHGPYRRNKVRPRTGEFLSRVPLYRRSAEMAYESSGHASLVHEESYDYPIHYPPYRYSDVESRITRRHLHRSDMDGRLFAEAVWAGEDLPGRPYYEGSGEIYPYLRCQMCYQGGRRAGYQALAHNMVQIPYSGEAVRSGYRVRNLHSHLYPGAYYSRPGWYSPTEPVDSYTASPQVFTDSEYYAWSRDTVSEEQRQRDQNISRLPLGRKSHPVQHIRPIGGAAPFITCYQCSELLQLPSDFLLFKGIRVHKVKCSACSSILKFALAKGFHLVPYTSKAEKTSLHSSSEVLERQKSEVESKHSQDKGKSVMVEMHNHATSSSSPGVPGRLKVTWEEPARSSSPLHRLMGYSSPSAVLYGDGSGDSDTKD